MFYWESSSQTLWRDGDLVLLTPAQRNTFALLARNAGICVPIYVIHEHLYGTTPVREHNIYVHIDRLRRVLGDRDKELIIAKRGIGYFLAERHIKYVRPRRETY